MSIVIAVDGTAASGNGTLAKAMPTTGATVSGSN